MQKLYNYLIQQDSRLVLPKFDEFCQLGQLENDQKYSFFRIRKENGKFRDIQEPCEKLKIIQKRLQSLFYQFPIPNYVFGLKGTSIQQMAHSHANRNMVLKIDIEKFFPNTTLKHFDLATKRAVWLKVIPAETFELFMEARGFIFLGSGDNYSLPTGAPTSPVVSSICFSPMDEVILNHAIAANMQYTRYIDDLVFSGPTYPAGFQKTIIALLRDYSYDANHDKGEIMYENNHPQIVTGIELNTKSGVPSKYRRKLRAALDHHARHSKTLDQTLLGKLNYVGSIDSVTREKLEIFFQKRVRYYQDARTTP